MNAPLPAFASRPGPGEGGARDTLRHQLVWNRLLSVVEEQAQTLIRTAFGTSTREAGDLSAGVFLPDGRMVAQAVTGTPGHVNSMAESVRHFLLAFPTAQMRAGDVYLTNDPWKGTGHLFDMTMVTPVLRQGEVVALFASTLHVVDIGGIGAGPDGTQVYHEGLFLPILKLFEAGEPNRAVFDIVRANVREPVQVVGDLHALVACNEIGARRLLALFDEFGLASLQPAGEYIIARSAQAMREAIAAWPQGSWETSMTIDGYESPLTLRARLTISGEGIRVDFAGSSPMVARGINVPKAYTDAYTSFGVRCLIGADIPNNAGSLAPVQVLAPEGSILNAPFPAAVTARHIVGQMLPDVVFGCLRQARAEAVPAEGASSLWNLQLSGGQPLAGDAAGALMRSRPFAITSFSTGGTGARPGKDGLSTTSFPSGVRNVSVEVLETVSPLVFWRKEYRPDSGGAGQWRGGLGQVIEVAHGDGEPMVLAAAWDRLLYPARGADGGEAGAPGTVALASGTPLRGKGRQVVPAGERLVMQTPGGGGIGAPARREPARLAADVRNGLVSAAAAHARYGAPGSASGAEAVPQGGA